jgi:hypothetical protein
MDRKLINTVPEAIDFLRTIDLEVIGIWHGWVIHGTAEDNYDFELTCDTNAELIDYARDERDMCVRLCAELGVASLAEIPRGDSSSSTATTDPTVNIRGSDSAVVDWENSEGVQK